MNLNTLHTTCACSCPYLPFLEEHHSLICYSSSSCNAPSPPSTMWPPHSGHHWIHFDNQYSPPKFWSFRSQMKSKAN